MHGLAETLQHAAFLRQIAQHQAGDQRRGGGHQQCHEQRDHHGEEDLLLPADFPQGTHDDLTLRLRGQSLHNGRLDHGHQCHIRVRRHGDGTQQCRSQHGRDEDRRGAVGTADNTHGAGLRGGEAHQAAAHKRQKNAQLRGCAQQQALGIGDQGPEIGHGTHAHKDQTGVDPQLDAQIQHVQQPHGYALPHRHGGEHRLAHTGTLQLREELRRDGASAEQLPVDVPSGEQDLVEHIRSGQVRHQHTDGDRHQQQRLELLHNAQKQQQHGDDQHNGALPVIALKQLVKARAHKEIGNRFHVQPSGVSRWYTAARRTPRRSL